MAENFRHAPFQGVPVLSYVLPLLPHPQEIHLNLLAFVQFRMEDGNQQVHIEYAF